MEDYKYSIEFLDEEGKMTTEKLYKSYQEIMQDLQITYRSVKQLQQLSETRPALTEFYSNSNKTLVSLWKKYRITSLRFTVETLLSELIKKQRNKNI